MRNLIAACCLVVVSAVPAAADTANMSRVDASRMTCAQLQERIRTEKEVVARFPANPDPSVTLHGRFVDSNRMCPFGTTKAYHVTVPTSDNKACPVQECQISR
jgi:hypothetical protein